MADDEDARLFKKYQPTITEPIAVRAASDYAAGNEIMSLATRRAGIDGVILLLATDSEVIGPFVMSRLCARELCARLLAEGHGP